MKKLTLLISVLILLYQLKTHANRAMYVDNFETTIGDTAAENTLLNYAQSNDIKILLLYGLGNVNTNHDLTNTASNFILADFIYKAKTMYDILYIGANGENEEFFTNIIDTYNNSRNNIQEKIDIYNLEFEYWDVAATGSGGYYCNSYLTPNGLPCTVDGAFQYFISTLQTMRTLATNNSHSITTEAYVGWPTTQETGTIGANLDRVRVHAYVDNPNIAFNYSANRLIDFANKNPNIDISIIFSSEPTFMQTWLNNNSMIAAENIFINDWTNASASWTNNVNLIGFTYFTYSYQSNILLSTNKLINTNEVIAFPNPVQNNLSIINNNTQSTRAYNNLGQLVLHTQEKNIDVSKLNTGLYFFKFQTDSGIETLKIIKN